MLTSFIRSIIIYIFLLIVMRLMGKKQLGELQPFEFVITLVASELACIPLSDMQTPLFYGFIPILTLLALDVIVTKLVKHSIKMRGIINGKPVIVITPNGIDAKALSNLDMTTHDLLEAIRAQNYLSPAELSYAIVETNGNVSCVPKAQNKPATVLDVNGKLQQPKIPYTIISEGKKLKNNYDQVKINDSIVSSILSQNALKQNEVLLLCMDSEEYYLQPIKGKCIQGQVSQEAL